MIETEERPMRSMREYVLRLYPQGRCTQRMTIGFRTTRVESNCNLKGYHVTLDGQWRCCEHYVSCERSCWVREMIDNALSEVQHKA